MMNQTHDTTPAQRELIARMLRGQVLGEFVFDVHAHTCDGWAYGTVYDGSAEGLHREMDALGFTGMAVSAICAISGVDFKRANDSLAHDITKLGNRIAAYVGVDIRQEKKLLQAEVDRYLAGGFSGGKLYTRWAVPYADPRYHPILEVFNARNMPVLVHCWGGGDITDLSKAAAKFPRINFIAAHTGSADLPTYMELAKKHDNLYIDTAFSRGYRGLIEQVVATIGSGKLLFGSDAALFSAAQQVARVVTARISDEDRRNILGGNARRLFAASPALVKDGSS